MSDQQELLLLHGRLIAGDLGVASKIVELVIAPLVAIVSRDVGGLHDRQDVEQVCYDALLDYLEEPGGYDSHRSKLLTFLAAKAVGKGRTLRRSQARRDQHEGEYAELQASFASSTSVDEEDKILLRIDWNKFQHRFQDRLIKDPTDAVVLKLLAAGESSLLEYANALKLPPNSDGLKEAGKRIERVRGRIRRIGKEMSA